MTERTSIVGKSWGHDCHCLCHYMHGMIHLVRCCDQFHKLYTHDIMREDKMEDAMDELVAMLEYCKATGRPAGKTEDDIEYLKGAP